MLKFWSLVYRLTGWYSPFARLAEYKHLKTQFEDIQDRYLHPECDMTLDDLVGLEIGLWQAANGFYRRWKR